MSDNLEAQAPTEQPESTSVLGEQTDWTATVPEKFKTEEGVNYEAIYKSYTELEKQFSSRETTPEDYAFEMPEGVELSDEDKAEFERFKGAFKEANLTQKQFETVIGQMMPTMQSAIDEIKQEYGHIKTAEAAKEELAQAWGDKYKQTIATVQNIAKTYNKSGADIDSYGFNDPNVLKLLADLSTQFKEAKPVDGQQVTDSLAQIRANPAYWDSRHPEHAQLQRRAMELTSLKVS